MNGLTEKFVAWCGDPSPSARLQRTIVQGLIGVLTAWLTSLAGMPEIATVTVVPAVMAVLAPIQACIAEGQERNGKEGTE